MAADGLETLYAGKFLRLVRRGKWEFVTRANASDVVGIIAITPDNKLLLVEQHRAPVDQRVIELPAGLVGDVAGNESESISTAAIRELEEETGYTAAAMTIVARGPSSAGLTSECVTLLRASGVRKVGEALGDGGEEITVHEIPLAQVKQFLSQCIAEGNGTDLKIYAALALLAG
jgi:ADP-ribose pyrophosphatase